MQKSINIIDYIVKIKSIGKDSWPILYSHVSNIISIYDDHTMVEEYFRLVSMFTTQFDRSTIELVNYKPVIITAFSRDRLSKMLVCVNPLTFNVARYNNEIREQRALIQKFISEFKERIDDGSKKFNAISKGGNSII